MQEATTTKTTIKDQMIENNVMPKKNKIIDCIGLGGNPITIQLVIVNNHV